MRIRKAGNKNKINAIFIKRTKWSGEKIDKEENAKSNGDGDGDGEYECTKKYYMCVK